MSSVKLISTHCLPTLLYRCVVWCIKQTESYKLNVIWNNAHRKIFYCCWRESVRPLLYYWNLMSISFVIHQRQTHFWRKLHASSHCTVAAFGMDIAICSRYGIYAKHISTYHVKSAVFFSAFEQSAVWFYSVLCICMCFLFYWFFCCFVRIQ